MEAFTTFCFLGTKNMFSRSNKPTDTLYWRRKGKEEEEWLSYWETFEI